MSMNRRQRIIVSVTGIFLVLLLLVGLTYAYFLTQITGNINNKSISVTTANLALVYGDDDGSVIGESETIIPGTTFKPKTFTVTNQGNTTTDYVVVIEDVSVTYATTVGDNVAGTATTFESNDFVYTLTCTSDGEPCDGVDIETTLPLTNEILVGNSIEEGKIHTYSLTVTYKDTGLDQSNDMNKVLSAKIDIDDIKNINPYSDDTTLLAYNIINNSANSKNGTVLRGASLTEPIKQNTILTYKESSTRTTGTMSVATSYQGYTWTYGTGYEIVENIGKFNLTGVSTCVYNDTTNDCISDLVSAGKDIYLVSGYVFSNSSSDGSVKTTTNLSAVYKVTKAPASSSSAITVSYEKITSEGDKSESSLSQTKDAYGTSYYYRGDVEDNYVKFNNICWRIVRIEGDGSIKMTLAGEVDSSATDCSSVTSTSGVLDTENVSYGYFDTWSWADGGQYIPSNQYVDSNTYADYEGNHYLKDGSTSNDSQVRLKDTLDAWYSSKFNTTALQNKLKEDTWCLGGNINYKYDSSGNLMTMEDVKYNQEQSEYNDYVWRYSAWIRLNYTKQTNLLCGYDEDSVTSKIGTLTMDELSLAGANSNVNTKYYLYDNVQDKNWWTLTLENFMSGDWGHSGGDSVYYVSATGAINSKWHVGDNFNYVRPTITLISGTTITKGDGTITNPYIVE